MPGGGVTVGRIMARAVVRVVEARTGMEYRTTVGDSGVVVEWPGLAGAAVELVVSDGETEGERDGDR